MVLLNCRLYILFLRPSAEPEISSPIKDPVNELEASQRAFPLSRYPPSELSINTEDGIPLSVDMPLSVILEVTHTEPGVKGNTATNATKPAIVETGAKINVPLFINEGDKIKIETDKGTYQERIKE